MGSSQFAHRPLPVIDVDQRFGWCLREAATTTGLSGFKSDGYARWPRVRAYANSTRAATTLYSGADVTVSRTGPVSRLSMRAGS